MSSFVKAVKFVKFVKIQWVSLPSAGIGPLPRPPSRLPSHDRRLPFPLQQQVDGVQHKRLKGHVPTQAVRDYRQAPPIARRNSALPEPISGSGTPNIASLAHCSASDSASGIKRWLVPDRKPVSEARGLVGRRKSPSPARSGRGGRWCMDRLLVVLRPKIDDRRLCRCDPP
jgi:hypothetical protein